MKYSLLWHRNFWPLFVTQFAGAFNDNFFKNMIICYFTYTAPRILQQMNIEISFLTSLAGALFILPYFIFSTLAGQLSDRFCRNRYIVWIKVLEIVLMSLGSVAIFTENLYFLLLILFLMGTQSTLFGPAKYSIIPQLLKPDELLLGNSFIEGGTYLAILGGTLCGGFFITLFDNGVFICSVTIVSVAVLGYFSSLCIKLVPPAMPKLKIQYNIFAQIIELHNYARCSKGVLEAIWGSSFFWLAGIVVMSLIPGVCKVLLKADSTIYNMFLAIFSIGIGCGAFLCNYFFREAGNAKNVFLSALGMGIFLLDFAWAIQNWSGIMPFEPGKMVSLNMIWGDWSYIRIIFDLFMFSVCGGLFNVPLSACIQKWSNPCELSRMVALNNIVNAGFMAGGTMLGALLIEKCHFVEYQVMYLVVLALIFSSGYLFCKFKVKKSSVSSNDGKMTD